MPAAAEAAQVPLCAMETMSRGSMWGDAVILQGAVPDSVWYDAAGPQKEFETEYIRVINIKRKFRRKGMEFTPSVQNFLFILFHDRISFIQI